MDRAFESDTPNKLFHDSIQGTKTTDITVYEHMLNFSCYQCEYTPLDIKCKLSDHQNYLFKSAKLKLLHFNYTYPCDKFSQICGQNVAF